MRDSAAQIVEDARPSRRAVRASALAGFLHLTLLVGLVLLTHPLKWPPGSEAVITVATWLLLYAVGAIVYLDLGPAWLSPARVVGTIVGYGVVILVLVIAVPGHLDTGADPLITAVTNYLNLQLYTLYVSSGAVLLVAVPVLLCVEYRLWLPVLVTGTVYGWALYSFWKHSQHEKMADLPPVTLVIFFFAFWFFVPLAAALAGAIEYHVRRTVRSAGV